MPIAAMAGFLVMAMAIPEVFGAGALPRWRRLRHWRSPSSRSSAGWNPARLEVHI